MLKRFSFFLLLFYSLLYSEKALAHSDHLSEWPNEAKALSKDLYERALLFSPEILSPKDSISHPYITISGRKVHLNSPFWRLVRGWLRVYQEEIKTYCKCDIDPEQLAKQARDSISQGFFQSKMNTLKHKAIRGMEEAAHLGARYGKTFLVLFSASEIAETILFKGNHLICKANNILVLFTVQPLQTFARILSDSKTFNQSRLLTMARWAWISRAVNKAQRNVFFHLESAAIKKEGLYLVNQEGPGNKREQWIQRVSKKISPLMEKIAKIDQELKENRLSERETKRLFKKKAALVKKADSATQLGRQSYLGERYKWLLGLISRKGRKNYLKGHSFPDEIFSSNWLWILAASENIMERAFIQTIEEKPNKYFMSLSNSAPSLPENAVRSGLAKEFSERLKERGLISNTEEHTKATEQVLGEVEKIFDPALPLQEKYITSSLIEMTLNGFFSPYMEAAYKKLTEGNMPWSTRIKLRFIHSSFYFYTTRYSAFLRTASLTKNKASLISYQYESMESLLSFFEYLIDLQEIIDSSQSKEETISRLEKNIRRIKTLQPYAEKKTAFRLFGEALPLCRDLVRR